MSNWDAPCTEGGESGTAQPYTGTHRGEGRHRGGLSRAVRGASTLSVGERAAISAPVSPPTSTSPTAHWGHGKN